MSYLQITLKCGFHCPHCCYSCTMRGKHGDYYTILDGIRWAKEQRGDDSISIGGGEPTMHPRFFDILRVCLDEFSFVWMATNGSQTKAMTRLSNIIDGCDGEDIECTCDEETIESGYCSCYDSTGIIYQENKLSVALSQDCFHDPIDKWVVDYWTRKANEHRHSGYEIRNVTNSLDGVVAAGRAKKTGAGWSDHCVCSDIMIKPDGTLRLCGCNNSPVIGNVIDGIEKKWEDVIYNDRGYEETNCHKSIKRRPSIFRQEHSIVEIDD